MAQATVFRFRNLFVVVDGVPVADLMEDIDEVCWQHDSDPVVCYSLVHTDMETGYTE